MDSSRAPAAPQPAAPSAVPERRLSLVDTTSMIVGIIIGSGLYETTPLIAANVPGAAWLLGGWLVGAAFALVGSLCYAELTSAYPAEGGDYVFLTRAFGRAAGFLFAWAQLWVIRPGSIGAMAYVFGRYATQLYPLGPFTLFESGDTRIAIDSFTFYAAGAVTIVTLINILGVREGKWTQNLLTAAKLAGLTGVVVLGFAAPAAPAAEAPAVAAAPLSFSSLGLALVLIVFTYGGWNDIAYVAAEVRTPERNILRALILGVAAVATVYLAVNLSFLHALGISGVAHSSAVAAETAELTLGAAGRHAIALLICISTLGAINGMVFTGARIYYAMGRDHPLLALFGRWSPRFGTPAFSLTMQGLCTVVVVVGFGTMAADRESRGFAQLINFTTPVFWCFLLASGVSLFALRVREPAQPRPFRVPLYPVVPIVFCLGAALIVYSSVRYAIEVGSSAAVWAGALMLAGLPLALLSRPRRAPSGDGG